MKKVIAYLHTHWDREWYREFEIFRLRLLRVFDNVLDMLIQDKIPSFYFDGQVCALEDYLDIRPEKTDLVKKFISEKRLYIGPCYTLVDEFLTDEICFRKNLEIGLEYSRKMGCNDFIGYFADTFGHSQSIPLILKEFGIDKAVVWRGVPDDIPSEFIFNGIDTVNLVRGYFNDIFSANVTLEKKAEFLKDNLDKIAKKSGDILLMPIGADHLGVPNNILEQVNEINKLLDGYEIELSNPFEYFELVKNNFKIKYNDELRDNSQTFILQGCYSARADIKKYSAEASEILKRAKVLSEKYGKDYAVVINYAYKLLLKNLAHDGICGCSTDEVHRENILRYKKVIQIAKTIIKEITLKFEEKEISDKNFKGVLYYNSLKKNEFVISSEKYVEDEIMYDTNRIPITEDFKPVYKCVKAFNLPDTTDLKVFDNSIENSKIKLEINDGEIVVTDKILKNKYKKFIDIIDFKDLGDTYNFAPDVNDKGVLAKILSSKILYKNSVQSAIEVDFKLNSENIKMIISLNKYSKFLNFKADWINRHKNHLLQIRFNLKYPVKKTKYNMMGFLYEREFDEQYDIRKNLPKTKGYEAKTNTAPFQKYLWSQGVEIITKGIFEYEVFQKYLSLTILRSTGIISNPKNPARTTPAGPPVKVNDAQLIGKNSAEFSLGFDNECNMTKSIDEIFPDAIIKNQSFI